MRVSLNWLQDYIDTSDLTADELAERLDLSGTAVENVFEEGAGLDKVVVAQIKKIRPHPKADRLVLCDVYTGSETVQIVCGAKNMQEGDKVALALPGAILPNGIKIETTEIRGQSSAGMLASEVELGLGEEASGIMILDPTASIGNKLSDALGLNDTILELEITPNRPDSMSMIGIAREVGAILNKDYKIEPIKLVEDKKRASEVAQVEVLDPDLCPRYIAKVITDVTVGQSPDWLKKRLLAAGARPINNLVDITNYVLFETGQPLHAFDYELLEGGKIIVRRAKKGQKITTLDEIERPLTSQNLIIADAKRAVAIAGVMGGANTEVNDKTKVVLLESAYFNPKSIGQTSRSLGLISESSIRFERGVDPNGTDYAANRAAQLMQQLAGGSVLKGEVDVYPKPVKLKKLRMCPGRANKVIGIDIKAKQMADILRSLDLEVTEGHPEPIRQAQGKLREGSQRDSSSRAPQNDKGFIEVGVPTFRPDLEREVDLIEEVARLYGLNNINSTLPGVSQVGKVTNMNILEDKLRDRLVGFGLKEAITYSFIDPKLLKDYPAENKKTISLKNPISEEQSVMRPALLPGLLSSLKLNVAKGQENAQLFELGTVFIPANGLPAEKKHLGIILNGGYKARSWYAKEEELDFFDAKGIVEALLNSLLITGSLNFKPFEHKLFNPQKSYKLLLGEEELGFIGQVHPAFASENDLATTAYAELDVELLFKLNRQLAPFEGISAYPPITLDVAMLVDKNIKHQEIVRSIEEMGHDLLTDIKLFDIYEGKGIEPGKKSMAYSLTYQSMERTLELAEVQKIHQSIIENLKKDLEVTIR